MSKLERLCRDVERLPVQRCTFLAKRLSKYQVARVDPVRKELTAELPIVLASPIYVTVAE